jgi:hypothetical protein
MVRTSRIGAAAAIAAAALTTFAATSADARRVSTDDPWPMPEVGACVLDTGIATQGCNPISLGFTVRIGSQTYNSIYLYDDGLISFGSTVTNPLSDTVEGFGTPVIAAGLSRIEVFDFPPYVTSQFSERVTGNPGEFLLGWYEGEVEFIGGVDPEDQFQLLPGSYARVVNTGYYRLLKLEPLEPGRARATIFTSGFGGPLGYSLGNVSLALEEPIQDDYVFEFGERIVPGIPEPASWALMIAGFGLVGLAARRRRAEALPAS